MSKRHGRPGGQHGGKRPGAPGTAVAPPRGRRGQGGRSVDSADVLELAVPPSIGRVMDGRDDARGIGGPVVVRCTYRPGMNRTTFDPRRAERSMAHSGRLVRDCTGSIEEMNLLLEEWRARGAPPPDVELTPIERAQDLMYEAYLAEGDRRVELAREALAASADCADAHVLLAEEAAGTLGEALAHYERGMAAGQRALGVSSIEELEGEMWGVLDTRPYMRARLGVAETTWRLRRHREAIAHEAAMLVLNPRDNQGVRFRLASHLLGEGLDHEMRPLLGRFWGEPVAHWLYSHALWTFRAQGPSRKAGSRLRRAIAENHYVPLYLLGMEDLPRRPPTSLIPGDVSEAVDYVWDALGAWRSTEGAVEWLDDVLRVMVR